MARLGNEERIDVSLEAEWSYYERRHDKRQHWNRW
jgi:hypothetical protein